MTDATYQDDTPDWAKAPIPSDTGENIPDWAQAPLPSSSAPGAVVRSAARSAIPTLAGAVGGIAGAAAGGALGNLPGAIAGGLAAAGGASWLAQQGQDWVLDKLGLREGSGFLSRSQEQADVQQHPYASEGGDLMDAMLAFGTGGGEAQLGERAISAGIMGASEGGQEYATEGKVDPLKVGMSAVAGAALPRPRAWTDPVSAAVTSKFSSAKGTGTGQIQNPVQTDPQAPGRPDIQGTPAQGADKDDLTVANDITTVAPGIAHENPPAPEVSGAGNPVGAPMQAREAAAPNDPLRDYRKGAQPAAQGVQTVQSQPGISTDPIHADVAAALASPQEAPVKTGIEEAAQPVSQTQQTIPLSENTQTKTASAPAPTEATVTPQQQKVIDTARQHLTDAGMTEALKRLDALPPDQQAIKGSQLLHAMESATGEAKGGEGQVRIPAKRQKLESGITAASKGDLARKQGAIDAIKKALAQYGDDNKGLIPTSVPDKQELIGKLTKFVNDANEANGGNDPIKAYRPNVKPPEWQLLRAAQRVVAKPTPKNIKDYIAAETLLRKKASPDEDTSYAKDVQDTSRIQADIDKKRTIPEAAAEAQLNKAAEGGASARQDFAPFDSTNQDESQVYTDQQNKLRSWLNNLNDDDYRLLANRHPDLASNLDTTQDPQELHMNLQDDLQELQNRSQKFSSVQTKPTSVRASSGSDRFAPTKAGDAASEGKSRADLIAEYNTKLKEGTLPGGKTLTPEERIAQETAASKNPENLEATPTVKPTMQAIRRSQMKPGSLDQETTKLEKALGIDRKKQPDAAEAAIEKSQATEAKKALETGLAPQRTRSAMAEFWKQNPVRKIFSPTTVSQSASDMAGVIREQTGLKARDYAQLSDKLEPIRPLVNSLPERARISFMKAMDTGKPLEYLPQLQPLADKLKSEFKDIGDALVKRGLLEPERVIESYFPHMFTKGDNGVDPNTFIRTWFSRQGSTGSLKERTMPTIADALKSGLKLASTDPIEVALRYRSSMRNLIESHDILEKAKDVGLVKTFKAAAMGASGNPAGVSDIPVGWVALKGRGGTQQEGQLYAPADAARIYNNYIDPGFHRTEEGGNLFDALQRTSNSVTALELGFSGYHVFTMAKEAIIHEVARGISKLASGNIEGFKNIAMAPMAPIRLYQLGKGDPLKAYLDKNTNVSPELAKVVDLITRSGGRMEGFRQDPTYKFSEMGSFFTAWQRGALANQLAEAGQRVKDAYTGKAHTAVGAIEGVGSAGLQAGSEMFRLLGRTMQTAAQPIFEKYIPAIKNGAFTEQLSDWLHANPKSTTEEQIAAARRIGDSVDNRFGEMVQDNIFWGKALKQSMQLAMRSYSWNLGTIREIGGGMTGLIKNPSRLSVASKDYDPRTAYVVAMPIVVAAASAMYQYFKTGKGPQEPKDFLAGRTGGRTQSGTPERAMLPGYEKDVYGWFNDPKQEALNKLATAPRLLWETMANRDYRGDLIANPNAPLETRLKQYFQHVYESLGPISVKQMVQGEKKGSNISAIERATAIRPAPTWLQEPERVQAGIKGNAQKEWVIKQSHDKKQNSLYQH